MPAWTEVWICPFASGHLQATGRDARGRKQYRYHPSYREVRDRTKFEHMLAFGQALPMIRRRVARNLSLRGLPRNKVLAAVVQLLDATSIRVGNEEYAKDNRSFGLTTLRNHHVRIAGRIVRSRFRGKSGQFHDIQLEDPRLAHIIKQCHDLPGYELFEYLDDEGRPATIRSEDVNQYLRELARHDLQLKDFRTWAGTTQALLELEKIGPTESKTQVKPNLVTAIRLVSERLGNRTSACRKYYIHPFILDSYAQGQLCGLMNQMVCRKSRNALRREDLAVMKLLSRSEKPIKKRAA